MTHINRIAAQDLGRIGALSDGIFAFAATVLVVEIRIPDPAQIHSQAELIAGLAALWPRLVTWLLSLMTLGIFWVGQQTQLAQAARADRDLTWLHFVFLAFVTALPFSTRLLAEYFVYEAALLVYWLNIALCGFSLLACVRYAERAGLLRADAPPHFTRALTRRVLIAQTLYAAGAALGLVSIPAGVGFIVLVQVNFALAPRIPWLWRI
ncbi:MAG: TMEM175 family protein [Roseiarcus sp.]|jgi:uncharacterized membrane protein